VGSGGGDGPGPKKRAESVLTITLGEERSGEQGDVAGEVPFEVSAHRGEFGAMQNGADLRGGMAKGPSADESGQCVPCGPEDAHVVVRCGRSEFLRVELTIRDVVCGHRQSFVRWGSVVIMPVSAW